MTHVLLGVAVFSLVAFLISLLVFVVNTVELKWAIAAGAIGVVGVGLALNSFMIALRADRGLNEINEALVRIEDLQKEIQKEQKEQADSRSPVVTSLQALSQHYLDYIAKQKSEDT